MSLGGTSDIVGKKPGRGLTGLLLVAIPVFLVGWMIIWPIISAIGRTVWLPNEGGGYGFALDTYKFFFTDQYSLNNLYVTLWTTGICAVLLVLICLPIALYLRFARGRLAAYVQGLAIFPMFVPSIILSYAIIRVLGPNGTVDLLLNAMHLPKIRSPYLTPWGPVIGLVWDNIPLTVLILLSGLGNVSNQSIEAARDVGAAETARALDTDTFGTECHRHLNRLFHRPAERNATLELKGDILGDELGLDLRLLDLLDVEEDFLARKLGELLLDLFDLLSLASDDDAGACRVDLDANTIGSALDEDARHGSLLQFLHQLLTDDLILEKELGEIFLGRKPAGLPVAADGEAKTYGISLLAHGEC